MTPLLHAIAVAVPLFAIVGYMLITDTFPALSRAFGDPESRLDPRVCARLSFCAVACFLIQPIAGIFQTFQLPWYWLAGVAVFLGFHVGRWWELLKRIGEANGENPLITALRQVRARYAAQLQRIRRGTL